MVKFKFSLVLFVTALTFIPMTNSKPQQMPQFIQSAAKKATDPMDKLTNRGYELITMKTDEDRRDGGKDKVRFLLRNWRKELWDEMDRNGTEKLPDFWVKEGPVKVCIHGWEDIEWEPGKKKEFMDVLERHVLEIAHAYGNRNATVNVIAIDWLSLSIETVARYSYVVDNVKVVAKMVTKFLVGLHNNEVTDPSRFHLIGYSMGAHVAGVVGKLFKEKTKKKLGRITGLDPIGAGFDDENGEKRTNEANALIKKDAEFVDVLHCTAGTSTIMIAQSEGHYGSNVPAGQVDFYPNGGIDQPGCKKANEVRIERSCSVKMCVRYFIDSVEGIKFYGCPCQGRKEFEAGECNCDEKKDGILMGDPVPHKAKGKYFVKVKEDNSTVGFLNKYV